MKVKRKGKKVSGGANLRRDARAALDAHLSQLPTRIDGPLFVSRSANRLEHQHVHEALKARANQANAQLPDDQRILFSAHVLRHTMLRKAAEKPGVQYAMELTRHTSSQYIWRYVKPTDEQKEAALDHLFSP